MKNIKKIVAILCAAVMLFTSFGVLSVSATTTYDEPVKPEHWVDAEFSTDHAYSFAFVGDTQFLTIGDALSYGKKGQTNKLQTLYQYIADTAADRKLAHVFVLGDMTDRGYKNDANLAGSTSDALGTAEWNLVNSAISKLNGIVPYSLCRGNHDDYMMDDYFNVSSYTNQFTTTNYSYSNSAYTGTTTNGGFYSDSTATWKDATAGKNTYDKTRVPANTNGYVYWSAKTGYHKESIVNSWKTVEISGTKYLFMTIDFNPTDNVLNWVNNTLESFPNHKAIITTHSYLTGSGEIASSDASSTNYFFGNYGTQLWDEVLSQHENVFMVVSGHVGTNNVRYGYNTGVNGNRVLQVLVDPQSYDTREDTYNEETGEYTYWEEYKGTQDTGMVLYMNFSADGQTITFDYYSTLLGKMKKYNDYVIHLDENDATVREGDIDLSKLDAYGQKNVHLTKMNTTAPTLDGKISANEYMYTKTTTPSESGFEYESNLNEYFGYDDEYVYYAFSIMKTKTDDVVYQFNFKPNYGWVDCSTLRDTHYPRIVVKFSIDEQGTVTQNSNTRLVPDSQVVVNMTTPVWNEDVFIAGSRSSDKVNTFELKISKEYFAENQYANLENLAYFLYLGDNMYSWLTNAQAERANAAVKAAGYTNSHKLSFYQYMIFDAISTQTTASVRISSTQKGLRFKSQIDTNTLALLKNDYKKVEIGTLIAPADLLNGKDLTHSIGVDGVDYIDVKSNVDKPYEAINGITTYAGSIVNISEKNLERDFSAVGYIKLTDEAGNVTYYYSNVTSTRKVSDVAEEAYFDFKTTSQAEYTNLVTADNDIAKGFYSPYTPGQRRILRSLIPDRTYKDPFGSDIF